MTHESDIYGDVWDQAVIDQASRLPGPILIVGASGFIGAKLFYSLASRRKDVIACSPSGSKSWRLSGAIEMGFTIHEADITDLQSVKSLIAKTRPRTVFNLAASGAYEWQKDPYQIAAVNYIGVLNLITTLKETDCEAFVQAGSSSEYGLNCQAPSESDELIPNSDYAVSKGAASLLVKYYGKIQEFPCINLRLYSVYGPWEDTDRLIPRLIEAGRKGGYPKLAAPETSRDFVYVDDCTAAFVAAASVCKAQPGESLNIATGTKTSLREIARQSAEIFSIAEPAQFGSMAPRKWDLSNWYGQPEKAASLMSWRAGITLNEGLRLTLRWAEQAEFSVSENT